MGMYRSELFLYPPMGGLRIERSRKEPCGLRVRAAERPRITDGKSNHFWRRHGNYDAPAARTRAGDCSKALRRLLVARTLCAAGRSKRARLLRAAPPPFTPRWATIISRW